MSKDLSGDKPPRVPDAVREAVRHHAEQSGVAEFSVLAWAFGQPEWQYDPAFEVDALRGALQDLPNDIMTDEGVQAVCRVADQVYQDRDG